MKHLLKCGNLRNGDKGCVEGGEEYSVEHVELQYSKVGMLVGLCIFI